MNFDTLCNIILEEKKQQKFSRIVITNPNPVFSLRDVMKDENDPSRGLRTYIDTPKAMDETGEIDYERYARRALRRLNWVTRSVIKRTGERAIDLRKLHLSIIIRLEKYLEEVMRVPQEQMESYDLKIAKEAAFIGNLLLPPTEKQPDSKGVFSISKDSIEFKDSKNKEELFSVADQLRKEFNMSVDEYLAAYDPDLIDTIKEIIKDSEQEDTADEEASNDEYDSADETSEVTDSSDEGGEEMQRESSLNESVSISHILSDSRVKGIYDPRIVRNVIKSLISIGSLKQDENGNVTLTEPGEESWRAALNNVTNKTQDDVLPTSDEISDLSLKDTEDTDSEVSDDDITSDDDTDDEDNINMGSSAGIAATRLGYKRSRREADNEVTDDIDDEDSEKNSKWYE